MKNDIEIHIERLMLHGFRPSERDRIGGAVRSELLRLLGEEGLTDKFDAPVHIERLDAGSFISAPQSGPEKAGSEIARRVHESLGSGIH